MSLNSSAMYIGAGSLSALAAALLEVDSFWKIGMMCGAANLPVTIIVIFAIRERIMSSQGRVINATYIR